MTTQTAARDTINDTIRTAWLADALTLGIELQWDDVVANPVVEDDDGNPLPWARVTVRHQTSTQETLRGPSSAKFQTEGLVTVQIFTPQGDGHALGDQIVEIVKASMRTVAVGNLWFFDVTTNEIGPDGPWFNMNVSGSFRYEEVV